MIKSLLRRAGGLLFFLCAALLLLCCLQPANAYAESPTSGVCDNGLVWNIENGTLFLSGASETPYFTATDHAPWYPHRQSIIKIEISSEIKTIGSFAFHDLNNLTEVVIPRWVKHMGKSSFNGCGKLKKMTLPFVGSSNDYYFTNNNKDPLGYIFGETDYEGAAPIQQAYVYGYGLQYRTYYIPKTLESITLADGNLPDYAFYNCVSLKEVVLPPYEEPGDALFFGCTGLTSVTIPYGATTLSNSMFYGCTALKTIQLPDSITTLGTYAFGRCTGLESIQLPSSVTKIYSLCFYLCSSLKTIHLPEGLETISGSAFEGCKALTKVTLPNSLTSVGSCAFFRCDNLEEINLPRSLTHVGDHAFYGCYNLKKLRIESTALEDLEPNNYAFHYAGRKGTGITVTIAPNVTKIPAYLFSPNTTESYYPAVKSVIFEGTSSCQSIGDCTFRYNRFLSTISLPQSVLSVGTNAFLGCPIAGITSTAYVLSQQPLPVNATTAQLSALCPVLLAGSASVRLAQAPSSGIYILAILFLLCAGGCVFWGLWLRKKLQKHPAKTIIPLLLFVAAVLFLGLFLWMVLHGSSNPATEDPEKTTAAATTSGSAVTTGLPTGTTAGTVTGSSTAPTVPVLTTRGDASTSGEAQIPTAAPTVPATTVPAGTTPAPTVPPVSTSVATAPTTPKPAATTAPTQTPTYTTATPTLPPFLTTAAAPTTTANYTLKVVRNSQYMAVGTTQQLALIYTGSGTIRWWTDDPSILSVSQTGVVTAHKTGVTYIYASDGVKTYYTYINVYFLAFEATDITLYLGETRKLNYTYLGSPSDLSWYAYEEGPVSVDQNGNVTALREGYGTVFVSCNGRRVGCSIRVVSTPVESFKLYKNGALHDGITKYVGDTLTLEVDAQPYGAPEQISCISSNPAVVYVVKEDSSSVGSKQTYTLQFLSPGTATITLISEDRISFISYTIHVKAGYDFAPKDPNAVIDPEAFSMYVLNVAEANGYREAQINGWRLLTLAPEKLTYAYAVSLGHTYEHTEWQNDGGDNVFQFTHIGTTESGQHQFYIHILGNNGSKYQSNILPILRKNGSGS